MEVSGKMADDTKLNLDLYCIPCDQDGQKVSAHGYCQDCQEHLCKTCYEHHRRPKPSRNHILLDKDAMPQQQETINKIEDDLTDICSKHRDKLLDFYCNDHKAVLCYVCVTFEHRQCKVDFIPDVSRNISDELIDLTTKMRVLVKRCDSSIRRAEFATKQLDQSHAQAVRDIKCLRTEINRQLDQVEYAMIRKADNLVNTAKRKLSNIRVVCKQIAEEVKCSQSVLNVLNEENKHNRLLIQMKSAIVSLSTLNDKERQIIEGNKTDDFIKFVRNEIIIDEMKIEDNFGTVSTCISPASKSTVVINYERLQNMTFVSDKFRGNIFGMEIISATQIIIADDKNTRIKMVNVDMGKLISEISLSSVPRDVTKLPQHKLAVTLPNEKCIQVVSYTDKNLYLDRQINVGEFCYCVAYCKGKLVVGCGYHTGKLVILDLFGNVLKVFDTSGLFCSPQNVVISRIEKYIYISDFFHKSKCLKIDWQGTVVQMYEDHENMYPKGLEELEDGTLLVCYKNSHNILRLSSKLLKCDI